VRNERDVSFGGIGTGDHNGGMRSLFSHNKDAVADLDSSTRKRQRGLMEQMGGMIEEAKTRLFDKDGFFSPKLLEEVRLAL
jgi:hypothetical protein